MQMPLEYGFDEQLVFSQGVAENASVEAILLANLPGACQVIPAHQSNDMNGTDWWVETRSGSFLSVDAKIRRTDWSAKGADDLALESWSVVEKNVVGWTRNTKKRTDYVLWLWKDTGRWCLVPFQMLCLVFEGNWQEWAQRYKTSRQLTSRDGWRDSYHSECIFVPRREVWAEIYRHFGGGVAAE